MNTKGVREMKSLLVLGKGDTPYSDRTRVRLVSCARKARFDVQQADYHEIGKLSDFRTKTINVMFFFPFTIWNANCEVPEDTRLYGTSRLVYEKFRVHFLQVRDQLEQKFGSQKLHYIIPPENAPIDRDKIETIRRLRLHGVPTSEPVSYTSLSDLVDNMTPERGIFIKCRYGAEGKGITILRRDKWVTNYKVDGDQLTNYGVYDRWHFTDITGRINLLRQLLQQEVIVEREILTPNIFEGKKFDLRAYVVGQKVPHLFVRVNDSQKEVTNFSQGALVKHHPHTGLTEDCLRLVRKIAITAAKAMELSFVGIDIMFDGNLSNVKVVEAQTFTDFPDIVQFNLVEYLINNAKDVFVASPRKKPSTKSKE